MNNWGVILPVLAALVLIWGCSNSQDGTSTKTDTNTVPLTNPDKTSQTNPDKTTQANPDKTSQTNPDKTTQANPNKTSQTNPDKTSQSASTEAGELKNLLERGETCMQEGNIRYASFYYANAIGKYPGNMEVIAAYRNSLLNAVKQTGDTETKYGYLAALELFLQNQIMNVSGEQVDMLAKWLDEISAIRNQIEVSVSDETGKMEAAEEESAPEAEDFSSMFEDLKTSLRNQLGYIHNTLKLAESDTRQLDIASYQLQECEQIMRGLITLQPRLNDTQKTEIPSIYADLQQLSEEVVDAKSKGIWEQYVVSHEAFLKQLNADCSYSSTPTKSQDNPSIKEETCPDGPAETRMKLIRKQMGELQKILPNLSGKYVGNMNTEASLDTAAGRLQQMQKLLLEATEIQQKKYNQWAMDNIRECLNEAKDGVGFWANGAKGREIISNALITYIAPIDQRFLTSEVSRAYQEVEGKYLADNQLNPAKDEKSLDEVGNKMNTLKRMFEMRKIQLSQF